MTRLCISRDQKHGVLPDGTRYRFVPESDPESAARQAKAETPNGAKCWWCGLRSENTRFRWYCGGERDSRCVAQYRTDGASGIWVKEEQQP